MRRGRVGRNPPGARQAERKSDRDPQHFSILLRSSRWLPKRQDPFGPRLRSQVHQPHQTLAARAFAADPPGLDVEPGAARNFPHNPAVRGAAEVDAGGRSDGGRFVEYAEINREARRRAAIFFWQTPHAAVRAARESIERGVYF